ncbi:hypothetical protein ACJ2A9_04565 [Anaerobacillus sp. MEB173]|uniref:hypothetical protein n=1 Tax=Anaerobacillus sp. MEB173 TaxID=3383345 RepID=UPI003F929CAD
MQVNNQTLRNQVRTNERPLELRQGEVYQATVKEHKGSNEAILSIRGRDVHAKFEGNIPSGDRVTIQVGETREQVVQVRTIAEHHQLPNSKPVPIASETMDVNRVLRNLGAGTNQSAELRQSAQALLDKGIPLTKETVQELRMFLNEAKGTSEQKVNTVQAVANKRLEVTHNHLRSVHEALNGRPLNQVLTDLAKEIDPKFEVGGNDRRSTEGVRQSEQRPSEVVRQSVQREPNLGQAMDQVREQVVNNSRVDQETARQVEKAVIEAKSTDIRPSEIVKQAVEQLQREANFQKAIEQVRSQLTNQFIDQEMAEQIGKVTDQAQQLQQQGRELAARQQVMQMLTQIEQELVTKEQIQPNNIDFRPTADAQQQYQNNELIQSQQLNSKDLIVNRITEKLSQAAIDFKDLKREITRNLDNVERFIQQFRTNSYPQVKPMLESTINKLDNAILKSEMMLLTDMKTEKQLMQASSQLADAKKLLSKGDYRSAEKIVNEVKGMLERLNFKPSETKVMHFIRESQNTEQRPAPQQLLQQFEETSRMTTSQEPSARQTFEMIRSLGLNRDSEVGQLLASREQGQQEANQRNMKSVLMQLLQNEELQGRASEQAKQALSNITGQQLLSKSDHANHLQTMMFNLPILLKEQPENLQIYVNSRNKGEEVDWENCSLYFLIETKKLGEVGIMVNVIDRKLSLTLKNDMPLFKEKMEPLADHCKDQLKEVGYIIAGINFTKMTATKPNIKAESSQQLSPSEHSAKQTATYTKKGFDYKV